MASDEEISRFEITDLTPLAVPGVPRWTGKVKLPRALRARTMVIFRFAGELVAISAACPHEGANLSRGRLVAPCVIECPLHQLTFDLRGDAIRTFKVEAEDGRMFLLWRVAADAGVAPTLGAFGAPSDDGSLAPSGCEHGVQP